MFEIVSKGIRNFGIFKEIKKFLKMQMKVEILYCTGTYLYLPSDFFVMSSAAHVQEYRR